MIRTLIAFVTRRWKYRSSITGRFVSAEYAKANPDTTYRSAR